jgi:hypothetical protein
MTHIAHETTLPADSGPALLAWTVTGTPFTRMGQAGEALAIAEAARLNLIAAQSAEKSGNGGEEKSGGGEGGETDPRDGSGHNRNGGDRRHSDKSVGGNRLPSPEAHPRPHHPAPPQAPPVETQATLAAQYRARIRFHRAAGVEMALAVARAAKEVPGYVGVEVKKRRKVL